MTIDVAPLVLALVAIFTGGMSIGMSLAQLLDRRNP